MLTYPLALIGFGNVGQGFAQVLRDQRAELAQRYGVEFKIVAVCGSSKGSLYEPAGLDPAELLEAISATGKLDSIAATHRGWDALRTIADSSAEVIIELSYTNLHSGEPATSHIRAALNAGKHVVTANKGPIALHYPELRQLAQAKGVTLGAEGTVMGGTPVLRFGLEQLATAGVTRVQGIINGTTNYILTHMEQGQPYAEALQAAQAQGYAEADPTGDVEGYDAAGKVVILANLLMDVPLKLSEVERVGITALTPQDIATAAANGERWKLIGKVERVNGRVTASVRPTRLPFAHQLASVSGITNALTFTTDLLGDVTLIGPGAGQVATGHAILGDLLAMHRTLRHQTL